MPELPGVTVYVERLNALLGGRPLEGIRLASPFAAATRWRDSTAAVSR